MGYKKTVSLTTFDIIGEHCLTQVVDIPWLNDKTLDLLFTNIPSPVNRVNGMHPIGKADHDIVYVEYDIKAKRIKQASHKIYLYKRAYMASLKDHMTQFGPQREKTCLQWSANNTGADQPAHPRSLISAFVIRFLESTICKLGPRGT